MGFRGLSGLRSRGVGFRGSRDSGESGAFLLGHVGGRGAWRPRCTPAAHQHGEVGKADAGWMP